MGEAGGLVSARAGMSSASTELAGEPSKNGGPPDVSLLAALVENSADAIIPKNLDGIITFWNRGAERIFGYAADEIIGRPVTILIAPERESEEPAILERLRRGERIDHFETVRRRKDGNLTDISLTISPLKDSADNIIG